MIHLEELAVMAYNSTSMLQSMPIIFLTWHYEQDTNLQEKIPLDFKSIWDTRLYRCVITGLTNQAYAIQHELLTNTYLSTFIEQIVMLRSQMFELRNWIVRNMHVQ